MKVLIAGGNKAENAANVLKTRFNVDVTMANTPEAIGLLGSAGSRMDRILVFEQAITADGLYIDKNNIRKRSQALIGAIKDNFDNFDMVCVADNHTVRQSMLEETFELKSRACVVYCKDNIMSASMLASLVGKTIVELVEQYKANEVDKSIYRGVDTVKWSSEIEQTSVWDDEEMVRTNSLLNKKRQVKFNAETGEFEEIDPETGLTPSEVAKKLAEEEKAKTPKKKWLFGNKKL